MKHKPVSQYVLIKKERKICPRCGDATYMALHKDRFFCGRCGYTEFLPSK